MSKQRLTVELDEDTIRGLSGLGEPSSVLEQLASVAAAHGRNPSSGGRDLTDQSLRVERANADAGAWGQHDTDDERADEVVRIAQVRADALIETARADADHDGRTPLGATRSRDRARAILDHDRLSAQATLESERAKRKSVRASSVAVEREATNQSLGGERANADQLIVDQREANQQMVSATLQAHEAAYAARKATERAEESESKLRTVAEFREMFLGILGHDLRNPLGSIEMSAQALLNRGHLDAADTRSAERIMRGSNRMLRMILQLLDLARTRLGSGLPIERAPTDLRVVCQSIVEEFGGSIQLQMSGDLTGDWDRDRLAEVLSNLAGNALEYAAAGTPVLVNARSEPEEVILEVSNQGAPIPAEVQPFIFEPFRRAKQTEKTVKGNLGLGLYIAKQVVLSHGGTLEAGSAGGTTTFVVRLPRHS